MNSKKKGPVTNRREVIKKAALLTAAATAVISIPFIWTQSRSTKREIVIRDSGGIYTQVYDEVLYKPFMQATGIKVIGVTSPPEPTAEIVMMVKSERPQWDIAAISHRAVHFLTSSDIYLERHELEDDPIVSSIPEQFISPYGVGSNVYSTVLAYRTDKFKKSKAPESWKDLWNIEKFPGRRSLRKHPFDTIEAALMASGVDAENVYPCDLDKAFRSLDKIKSHIAVWWMYGPQAEQLLKNGEIDLALMWSGRVQEAIKAGVPITVAWDQHVYKCENWAILKGTPNIDLCRQFIKFASDPKRQALLAPLGIGPVQPDAFKYIKPEQKTLLPTYPENLRKGLCTDAAYWLHAQKLAIERFNEWMMLA